MHLPSRHVHLTYCTNVHPSTGLADVKANLDRVAVQLRDRLSPAAPFGVGLRLSGAESRELLEPGQLAEFRAFLDTRNLYVFTLNGFPYGTFHGQPVKADVHAPDWRDEERVAYTERLAHILAGLLPPGQEGGISTSPLSYRAWVDEHDPHVWTQLTRDVVRVVRVLAQLHQERGCLIHLDLEPEPDGLLECSDELARYFQEHLMKGGAEMLAALLMVDEAKARALIVRHVRVCFDTCHVAVMYEEPSVALDTYRAAGMQIGKVQLSSALQVLLPDGIAAREEIRRDLTPFVESTYLHQVIVRRADGGLTRYPDLPAALANLLDPDAREWRVHFHVPVFTPTFGALQSTQASIVRSLDLLGCGLDTTHLEIETYTWDVLPDGLKLPLLDSVEREFRWVLDVF